MKTDNIIRNTALLTVVAACLAALSGDHHQDSPLSDAPRTTDVPRDNPGDGGINLFDTRLILPFFKAEAQHADRVALENRLASYFPE